MAHHIEINILLFLFVFLVFTFPFGMMFIMETIDKVLNKLMATKSFKMMPNKGTVINAGALTSVVVLSAFAILQGFTLEKMEQYNDDSQRFIEYWRHKTDSLSDENFKLYMHIYDLKDSIITLKTETK